MAASCRPCPIACNYLYLGIYILDPLALIWGTVGNLQENFQPESMAGMTINSQVVIWFLGSIPFFWFAAKLWNIEVPHDAPPALSEVSLEERKKKMRRSSWLSILAGCIALAIAARFAFH
jgi:hypothetical protein